MSWQDDLDLALRIADAADAVAVSRYLATDLVVETKPDATPVTEADKATEETIRALLARERPGDAVLGEEFGSGGQADRRWIIDPIDGTKNYLRGVPVWSVLIALEADGEVVVGVASAPALGRRWWASRGGGAFTRDVDGRVRQIRASAVAALADASFSYSDEDDWVPAGHLPALRELVATCWRVRAYGDFLSHVLVAEGAVDVAAEVGLKTWDVAALIPIVTESGGQITTFDGGAAVQGGSTLSTNGHLHEAALGMLRRGGPTR